MHCNLIDSEFSIFQPFLFTLVKSSPYVLFLQFFKLPVSGGSMLGFIHLLLETVILTSVPRPCQVPGCAGYQATHHSPSTRARCGPGGKGKMVV